MKKVLILSIILCVFSAGIAGSNISIETPSSANRYGIAEFVIRLQGYKISNPFTEILVKGKFTSGNSVLEAEGFCDSQDGSVFRLRFSPENAGAVYSYNITVSGPGIKKSFNGNFTCINSTDPGPVITDPEHPKHFIYKGSKKPFYHLGNTVYGLVDIANIDEQIIATIDYCYKMGFNKIRFLLTGYPRDYDNRSSDDVDYGVPEDPWKAPNYGSLPGRVNPIPAWEGKPHNYDFERFNIAHWQRVDDAVRRMKEKGIIATCIILIEKQNLPKEIGELTENEYRLYRYAVARLAAFSNVWWDLGNEHNEFRKPAWGNKMGNFVKEKDPYDRLASAHAHADFYYNDSPWADFIITQQYGDLDSVYDWAMDYYDVPKPYINEEYGYEGRTDKPVGHGMNSNWVRKCHWAIAMAGGYATYGDWSDGTSYFYMGIPGPGKAASQLGYLRSFFESIPFNRMIPSGKLTSNAYCLSGPDDLYVLYLPEGGATDVDLSGSAKNILQARWFDPVTGNWSKQDILKKGKNTVNAPSGQDWVCLIGAPQTLSVASVQMRSSGDIRENAALISGFIRKCATDGARVVVFPECALTSYDEKVISELTADQINAAEMQVADACRVNNVYAVVGLAYRDGTQLLNSASIISPDGKILDRYHKIQLAESWPVQGDHMCVFHIDGIPCSVIICHDERYPELVRLPVLAGAKVIFYISHESGVKQESKIDPYRAQIQARAVENGVFIVQANAPANPDATGSHGQSRIIAPDGNIIVEALIYSEEVISASLDIRQANRSNALKSVTRGILQEWWKEGINKVRIIE